LPIRIERIITKLLLILPPINKEASSGGNRDFPWYYKKDFKKEG
jgi:hypothetical protein